MDKTLLDNLQNLNFDDILKVRQELEQYVNVINEYVITSKTDLHGVITYTSKAFEEISGYSENELIGKPHSIIRHPDMPKTTFKEMWDTITKEQTWSGEVKNKRKDGSYYWVSTTITPTYDHYGKHIGYTSVRQDISDKKKIEEVSLTDELTGLYNRRYYNKIVSKEINRAHREKKVFSFLILDIDNFKTYNDNYGHQKGDKVLQQFGTFLSNYFKRSTDIVFRLGGEEFCIIFITDTIEQSIKLSENLCKEIENLNIEHKFSSISNFITTSAGLAVCDFNLKDLQISSNTFYKKSDEMLYIAKNSGKNKVKVFNFD